MDFIVCLGKGSYPHGFAILINKFSCTCASAFALVKSTDTSTPASANIFTQTSIPTKRTLIIVAPFARENISKFLTRLLLVQIKSQRNHAHHLGAAIFSIPKLNILIFPFHISLCYFRVTFHFILFLILKFPYFHHTLLND